MSAKEDNPKRERKERSTETKIPTNQLSYNLFKQGKSIAEIAAERNMTIGTIEGHLVSFVASGEIDINKVVSGNKQLLINAAVRIHGTASTKLLKESLPDDVTYNDIRMVMASHVRNKE